MYQISGKRYRANFWIALNGITNIPIAGAIKIGEGAQTYAKEVAGWIYVIENTETGYRFKIGIESGKPNYITDLKTGMLFYSAIPEVAGITRKAKPLSIKASVEQFLASAYPNAYESAMKKGSFDEQVSNFKGFNNNV